MPRQFYDPSNSDKNALQTIVPITLGGTGSSTVEGAAENLGFIQRNKINQRWGVAGLNASLKISTDVLPYLPINKGGTGAGSALEASNTLGFVNASTINQPLGPIGLNEDAKIPGSIIKIEAGGLPNIDGPAFVYLNETAIFQITDFDSFTTYTLSALNGDAVRINDQIHFTASGVPGVGSFTLNGKKVSIEIRVDRILKPTITSPTNAAVDITLRPTITVSAFTTQGIFQTQTSVEWEISTDPLFTTVFITHIDTQQFLTWTPPPLDDETVYYVRVRQQGSLSGWSEWSDVVQFTTGINAGWVMDIGENFDADVSSTLKINKYTTAKSIFIDHLNYIYITGSHIPTSTTTGMFQSYIAKFDPTGTIIWQRLVGADAGNFDPTIVVDAQQNVYIFSNDWAESDDNNAWLLVTKLNEIGDLVWMRYISNLGDMNIIDSDIHVNLNMIVLCGYYQDTYDPINMNYPTYPFILKMNTDGVIIWQKAFDLNDKQFNQKITSCVCDDNGDIYIGGRIRSQRISFGNDAFIAKLNADGDLIWGRKYDQDPIRDPKIALDSFKNVYLTFFTQVDIINGTTYASSEGHKIIVLKLDSNGQYLWQRTLYHLNNNSYPIKLDVQSHNIAVDHQDRIWVVGSYQFKPDGSYATITLLNYNGSLVKSINLKNEDLRYTYFNDIRVDRKDNLYLVGSYYTTHEVINTEKGWSTWETLSRGLIVQIANDFNISVMTLTGTGMIKFGWEASDIRIRNGINDVYASSPLLDNANLTINDALINTVQTIDMTRLFSTY